MNNYIYDKYLIPITCDMLTMHLNNKSDYKLSKQYIYIYVTYILNTCIIITIK